MAQRLGIPHGTLSRLKYEPGAAVNHGTLAAIVESVSEDADEQARFLACYLRDRMAGPEDTIARIRILVDESPRLRESAPETPPEIRHAADHIATAAMRSPKARDLLMAASALV